MFSHVALAATLISALAGPNVADADPVPLTPRIIGGQQSAAGDFPSVVALLLNRSGYSKFQRQLCGGTLIAPRWVLTAAHCVISDGVTVPSSYYTVLSGTTRLDNADRTDRSGEIAVLSVFPHLLYGTPGQHDNDIALLELAEAVDQPPIALYNSPGSTLPGVDAFLVGWGAVDASDADNQRFDDDQQFVSVPIVSNSVCNEPSSYDGQILDSQLCAGLPQGGKDSCQGDSGGPMIIGIDGYQVQVGVVSYGYGCALPNYYGVYTNVSSYRAWISNLVSADFLPADPNADDQSEQPQGDQGDQPDQPEAQNPFAPLPPAPGMLPSASDRDSGGGGALIWWIFPAVLAWKSRQVASIAQS